MTTCLSQNPQCSGVAPCDACKQTINELVLTPAATRTFAVAEAAVKLVAKRIRADEAHSRSVSFAEEVDQIAAELPRTLAAAFLDAWAEGRAFVLERVAARAEAHKSSLARKETEAHAPAEIHQAREAARPERDPNPPKPRTRRSQNGVMATNDAPSAPRSGDRDHGPGS